MAVSRRCRFRWPCVSPATRRACSPPIEPLQRHFHRRHLRSVRWPWGCGEKQSESRRSHFCDRWPQSSPLVRPAFFLRRSPSTNSCSSSEKATDAGVMLGRHPSSLVSSRSSLMVKATSIGPRRPITCTRSIVELARASRAADVISVEARWSIGASSTRATSKATLPCPKTTASGPALNMAATWSAVRPLVAPYMSGWPLYQLTKARADSTPGRSSPGTPSSRSAAQPYESTVAEYLSRTCANPKSLPSDRLP
mmetsp:Transcript_3749/g.11766  ORF Transcript_3749/g.11766 Transcript_3749/m.11766 type:complete len:253 (-) Transcript_3749:557-1315(-)